MSIRYIKGDAVSPQAHGPKIIAHMFSAGSSCDAAAYFKD
jgi:hypothetical protein